MSSETRRLSQDFIDFDKKLKENVIIASLEKYNKAKMISSPEISKYLAKYFKIYNEDYLKLIKMVIENV